MSPLAKFAIGLAAALAAGAIGHGPGGFGEDFVDRLDARAQAVMERAALPGVSAGMQRDPLARTVILSGPADRFQREGQGSFPGINERIEDIAGVAGYRWTSPPPERAGLAVPLLVEMLLLSALAFLIGLGLGRLLFGRRRRESFLD